MTYQIGSKGDEIKKLQQQLTDAGYDPKGIDGIYGNNTAAAVKAYQQANNLTVDGIAGTQTLGSLNRPATPATPVAAPTTVTPMTPEQARQSLLDTGKYETYTDATGRIQTRLKQGYQTPTPQPAQPQQALPAMPEYQSPYTAEMQKALQDYQNWASQPYVSEYAPQIESLISNIMTRQFNYNPATDAQAQLAIKELTRNVLETMNSKGILNSSITENQLQQGISDILPQYQQIARQQFMDEGNQLMSQVDMLMGADETAYGRYQDEGKRYADVLGVVMDMDENQYTKWKDAYTMRYQQKRDQIADEQTRLESDRQKITDAWDRVSELGYVDNQSSIILGVEPGTLSKEAREAKQEIEARAAEQKQSLQNQLATINAQYEKEKKVSTLKENSTAAPEKLGNEQQVQRYYELRDIYFGGGSGTYANDPLKAYNWLVAHAKNNIALIGQGLYNKLLAELTDNMKVQKSYGEKELTNSQEFTQQSTVAKTALSMKTKIVDGGPAYTNEEIASYIINSGLDAETALPSVLQQVFTIDELRTMGLWED